MLSTRLARWLTSLVGAGALLALTSCIPKFGTPAGPLTYQVITTDGADAYGYVASGDTVTITAPTTNHSYNLREFYWRPDSVFYADQESCQRWDTEVDASSAAAVAALTTQDGWQPGIGLRIAPSADGKGIRGISVDQNILYLTWWVLWVDVWDSSQNPPFHGVQSIDISPVVGSLIDGNYMAPPPWNVCAQAYGNHVRVKVWLGADPEPPWTDPTHVFSTTLPQGWDYAGYPGGYVAHLQPGATQQVTTLRTGPLMPDGSPPPTEAPTTSVAPTTVP